MNGPLEHFFTTNRTQFSHHYRQGHGPCVIDRTNNTCRVACVELKIKTNPRVKTTHNRKKPDLFSCRARHEKWQNLAPIRDPEGLEKPSEKKWKQRRFAFVGPRKKPKISHVKPLGGLVKTATKSTRWLCHLAQSYRAIWL